LSACRLAEEEVNKMGMKIFKLQTACHYTPNPINYDLRNKPIPEVVPLTKAGIKPVTVTGRPTKRNANQYAPLGDA